MSTYFIAGEGGERERQTDSTVSIVTKLRAGRSGVRIPAVTRDISILQNAHPSSYSVGIGVSFSGGKDGRCEDDHSPPCRAEVKNEPSNYNHCSKMSSWCGQRQSYLLSVLIIAM